MKFLKILWEIVLYIWQLPQNIVGLITHFIMGHDIEKKDYRGASVWVSGRMSGGISLGKYITLSAVSAKYQDTWNHEWGHTRQSLYLGPLYLLVIGIPSICWAGIYGTKLCPETHNGYYKLYCESWADKLGGVVRK